MEQANEIKDTFIHLKVWISRRTGSTIRDLLTGCAMRCQFCHNPDTWNLKKGTLYTADELLKTALRYRTYWGDKGGITVSGGEPLLQIDFLIELFRKAKGSRSPYNA